MNRAEREVARAALDVAWEHESALIVAEWTKARAAIEREPLPEKEKQKAALDGCDKAFMQRLDLAYFQWYDQFAALAQVASEKHPGVGGDVKKCEFLVGTTTVKTGAMRSDGTGNGDNGASRPKFTSIGAIFGAKPFSDSRSSHRQRVMDGFVVARGGGGGGPQTQH